MDPILREILLPKLEGVRKSGGYVDGPLPGPRGPPGEPAIGRGTTQPVVLNCHAGCDPVDILAKIGLTWDDLCEPREREAAAARRVDPARRRRRGLRLHRRGRQAAVPGAPDRRQAVPASASRTRPRKSGWRWSLGGTRRVLYRLPKVIEAVSNGEVIYVCEGEKDVHALERAGVTATCNPGGAGKWREEYSRVPPRRDRHRSSPTATSPARRTPGRSLPAWTAWPRPSRSWSRRRGHRGGDSIKDVVRPSRRRARRCADFVVTWASGDAPRRSISRRTCTSSSPA